MKNGLLDMLAVALRPLGIPFIYFTAVIIEAIGGSPFTRYSVCYGSSRQSSSSSSLQSREPYAWEAALWRIPSRYCSASFFWLLSHGCGEAS